MFFEIEKFPTSFSQLIPDVTEYTVRSYDSYRSDRVTREVVGQESLPIDLLIMRLNSLSPLRLSQGAVVQVHDPEFLVRDVDYGI